MSWHTGSVLALAVVVGLPQVALTDEAPSILAVGADFAHRDGIAGRGVTVAVIDDGLQYSDLDGGLHIAPGGITILGGKHHPESQGQCVACPHGTAVAKIIAGNSGMAPGASILPIRIALEWEVSTIKNVALGIMYATRYRQRVSKELRVINISWGGGFFYCSCDRDPEIREAAQAISAAADAGIVTVCSTGNDASCYLMEGGGVWAPSCASDALRVVAGYYNSYSEDFRPGDKCWDLHPSARSLVCYSNFSDPCGYVEAPGADIVGFAAGNERLWGTSFAAPHASGTLALMFSKAGPASTMTARQAAATLKDGTFLTGHRPPCPQAEEARWLWAPSAVGSVWGPVCGLSGDLDGDATVSADDFHWLEGCVTGPATQAPGDIANKRDFGFRSCLYVACVS